MTTTIRSIRHIRHLTVALAAVGLILPGTAGAASLAELEVTEYSRSSPGASVAFGYFVVEPDLVTSSKIVTPTNDGSDDEFTKYFNRYRDSERVNTERNSGIAILGGPAPGHSYAKAFGYADAGADALGRHDNMGAYARALAGEDPSTGYAKTRTKVLFTWTVGPGDSGAAVGETVTDLRWEFGTDGFLTVQGTTWPEITNSVATMDFSGTIYRGPGGLCGVFDCPTNTPAAKFDFYAALQAVSQAPAMPDNYTGTVWRYRDWDASSNAGDGGSWGDGPSWGEQGAWVLAQASTFEDALISRVMGVNTGDDFSHIDFDATVGETLRLIATLTVDAAVDGVGEAQADFWETFTTRIYDPLDRGYTLDFAVRPIPEPASGLLWLAALSLIWKRRQR